jgi:VanZ family protein
MAALAAYVCVLLAAGLGGRGRAENHVTWAANGPGIVFDGNGLAFTRAFSVDELHPGAPRPGFTLELGLRPDAGEDRRFRFIAVVHAGRDASQLVIAQWGSTLIAMNGDDYDHRRRLPRLSADLPGDPSAPVYVVVRSDPEGSVIFIDGRRAAVSERVRLRLPLGEGPSRLIAGNSAYGTHPWRGEVVGLALSAALPGGDSGRQHLALWERDHHFASFDAGSFDLCYPFREGAGRYARDHGSAGIDLEFPAGRTYLLPRRFEPGIDNLSVKASTVWDLAINLFGFVPLGFLTAATLSRSARVTAWRSLMLSLAAGAGLSFGIELAQGWMPARSSSQLDLALNSMGALLGAALHVGTRGRLSRRLPSA